MSWVQTKIVDLCQFTIYYAGGFISSHKELLGNKSIGRDLRSEVRGPCALFQFPLLDTTQYTPQPRGANKSFGPLIDYSTTKSCLKQVSHTMLPHQIQRAVDLCNWVKI